MMEGLSLDQKPEESKISEGMVVEAAPNVEQSTKSTIGADCEVEETK